MDPIENTTRIQNALDTLLTQFRGLPVVSGLVGSYAEQCQLLETVFFELLLETKLDAAAGAQLDGIGAIVGEPRRGRSDTLYRYAIKSRIRRNRLASRANDILEAMNLTWPSGYDLRDLGLAAFVCRVRDGVSNAAAGFTTDPYTGLPIAATVIDAAELDIILQEIKGAGIEALLQYQLTADDYVFMFADADAVQADTNRGFADDSPIANGGFFSDIY